KLVSRTRKRRRTAISRLRVRLTSRDQTPMTKIAILGGTGYTAVELIKILLRHPHAEIVAVTSRDEKMPAVAESHPSLAGRIKLRMEPFDVDKLTAKGVECVFGCLPHGASMDAIAAFLPSPPVLG